MEAVLALDGHRTERTPGRTRNVRLANACSDPVTCLPRTRSGSVIAELQTRLATRTQRTMEPGNPTGLRVQKPSYRPDFQVACLALDVPRGEYSLLLQPGRLGRMGRCCFW